MAWYWWAVIVVVGGAFMLAGLLGSLAEGPGESTDTTDGYP